MVVKIIALEAAGALQRSSPLLFLSFFPLCSFLVGFLGVGRLLAIAVLSVQWFRGLVTDLKPLESLGFGYAENQGEMCAWGTVAQGLGF